MRFLSLKRNALMTLESEGGILPGTRAALTMERDAGQSVVDVLLLFAPMLATSLRTPTHLFHYTHRCCGQPRQDLWILEKDMPDADGEHFVCLACGLAALNVKTVPQQPATIQLGDTAWPP